MYIATLNINNRRLSLSLNQGYIISTIEGLTGTKARVESVQASNGIGEAATGGSISGQNITIRGKILDHNISAKQALLDTAIPLGEGTLTLYNIVYTPGQRPSPYRSIDVIVKGSPTIEQKKHAKFVLSLYAPSPVWYSTDTQTITLRNTIETTFSNNGHYPADYTMKLNVRNPVKDMSLYVDGMLPTSPFLYINYRKINPNGVTGTISFGRKNGKIYLTVGEVNAIQCLSTDSTLWALPVGTHSIRLQADSDATGDISFAEGFAGVILSGI